MKPTIRSSRRSFFRNASLAAGAAALTVGPDDIQAAMQSVHKSSRPSDLKITDLRVADVHGQQVSPSRAHAALIKIYTNQGLVGLGEVRDGADPRYALMLKSRLLGQNPCNVDQLFRRIKQFGGHSRQGGGVCGVEMALWDLAGKAFDVPAYQMLGGKFRDKVRIYADTPISKDPHEFARRLTSRIDRGYTFLKMDLGTRLFPADSSKYLTQPVGRSAWERSRVMHPLTGEELTPAGVDFLAEFVSVVREAVGMQVPLAADHFGHIGLNSCIRLGKALEKYNLAWLEDMVPWQQMDLMKQITDAVDIPVLTGEDIFLKEDFARLVDDHVVDIIHPDLATSGGLLETKKIGDYAQEGGVAMAMHFAGTPVSFMANIHCAAATENVLAVEHHSVDTPWWEGWAANMDRIVVDGFVTVPDGPGLGIELNEDMVKERLVPGSPYGAFGPTDEWNETPSNDRLWS